ncbi:endonuclease/exonuclease/phosphatase family protein [Nocardioides panaciterrulae]|uniref:Endonuclease/exonuclease/phosphatase domain-containing protein n=1 Tax=Nocardioides panaciterrulae TaxID=661492 RepID=A0A7Y9JDI7_9ACTN|nr:endonuclease/exonuclease/phosphatase family protein [Nocardioides panaciterrulae]NYD43314.1 hypothetical protein [Nocardioides panaciterrulae]
MVLGPAPEGAAADGSGSSGVPVRVGTYNIRAGVRDADFTGGVAALLPRVDVAGLQEIARRGRQAWLADRPGWGCFRPREAGANPVVWRSAAFDLLDGYGALLAHGRHIGDEKPAKGHDLDDQYATVVHLQHLATDQEVTVIDVHLLAGATTAGRRRHDRPLMFGFYRDEVRSLAALVEAERATGRVFVLGDFNIGYAADARWHDEAMPFARLAALGMVSMWRDCGTAGRGTHGPQ